MILYSIITVISLALIVTLNTIFNPAQSEYWWFYLVYSLAVAIIAFLLDALIAFVIRRMPAKWFSYRRHMFQASDKEMRFYKFIKVDAWKNYVPELGGFTSFHKDKVVDPNNNKYMERFILEACYGVSIHIWSVPASFLLLLLDYKMYAGSSMLWLTICLPIAVINAILVLLPAFILKYNLRRLTKIYELNLKKEKTVDK
jgi:hypothetical protein